MFDQQSYNRQITTRRTFLIGTGKLGLLCLLSGRMFFMQFIKKDEYKTLSDKNRIKIVPLVPRRGTIFDCNNEIIATNKTCFNLLLDKSTKYSYADDLEIIIKILELDEDQIGEVKKRVKRGGYRIPVLLINHMDWEQVATIEERKGELRSSFIDTGLERYYPSGEAIAHLIGYLGKPSEKFNQLHDETFKIGKNGIEKFYNEKLIGGFGHKRIEVNSKGRYVRELDKKPSKDGNNLLLNIDIRIQQKSIEYLDKRGCSAVVMDCTNGNVMLYSSAPMYDPNEFNKLSSKYWKELIGNPYKPLIDKVSKSLYSPGSVFKMVTILAALESGMDPKQIISCTGGPALGGRFFRCWKKGGHGRISMMNALKHSCNSYMYYIAKKVGIEKIAEVARKFGFGSLTGIDIPGEVYGTVPDIAWKKKRFNRKWTLGDSLNVAIGQGFLLCTPVQLVRMTAAIANGGILYTPQIAKSDVPQKGVRVDISDENLEIVREAMYQVVNTPGGTGYRNRIEHQAMIMAGKTGTVQVRSKKNAKENLSASDVEWESRNHATFCGFAPYDNPKYAVAVYYDHGGGGSRSAAPIAKKIMLDIMNKDGKEFLKNESESSDQS